MSTTPTSTSDTTRRAKSGFSYVEFTRETAWGSIGKSEFLPADDYGTVRPAATSSDRFTFIAESRLAA
jgi:hypothetical protein